MLGHVQMNKLQKQRSGLQDVLAKLADLNERFLEVLLFQFARELSSVLSVCQPNCPTAQSGSSQQLQGHCENLKFFEQTGMN